jgi:hypothetical protein
MRAVTALPVEIATPMFPVAPALIVVVAGLNTRNAFAGSAAQV